MDNTAAGASQSLAQEALPEGANSEYTTVEMELRNETMKQIDRLLKKLNADSGADVVKQALNIAEFIVEKLGNREKIVWERRDGTRAKVEFPGIRE